MDKLRLLLILIEAGLEGGDPDVDNVIWVSFVENEPAMVPIRDIAGPRLRAAIEQMNAWMFQQNSVSPPGHAPRLPMKNGRGVGVSCFDCQV